MTDQHGCQTRNENMTKEKNAQADGENHNIKLTVNVEIEGTNTVSAMELMKCVRELCGGLLACRFISENKYEMTMSHPKGKERLMEGFKIGDTRIHARELKNDEVVVSFLHLPFYVEDQEILAKLQSWGVSAASAIKRRMWPGTKVADGTRFLKVKFNDQVQSLPYSAKFNTALGAEYFRVIHDRQIKVCRMCIQPGHILRECPEFLCHKCGVQGHYARECKKTENKCSLCHNRWNECTCNVSENEVENASISEQENEINNITEGEMSEGSNMEQESGDDSAEEADTELTIAKSAGGSGERQRVSRDSTCGKPKCKKTGKKSGDTGLLARPDVFAQPTPTQPVRPETAPDMTLHPLPGNKPLKPKIKSPLTTDVSDSEMDISKINGVRKRTNDWQTKSKTKRNKDTAT